MLRDERNYRAPDRRGFLSTAAAGAAALALGDLSLPKALAAEPSTTTDVEKFLSNFPAAAQIPGIQDVEIIRHTGANRVLCVFEQVHWVDNIKPEELPFAEQCQLQLYHAYRSLKHNSATELSSLYVEGVYHSQEDEILDVKREDLKTRLQTINRPFEVGSLMSMSLAARRPDPKALKTLRQQVDGSSTLAKIGAAELLGFHRELSLIGAENKAYYLKTFELEDQQRWDELDEYLYTKREDALLGFAAEAAEKIAYTVYGANHNFRDNVIAFNKAHDQKFSLILLTPPAVKSFREYSKKLEEAQQNTTPLTPPPPARTAPVRRDRILWGF